MGTDSPLVSGQSVLGVLADIAHTLGSTEQPVERVRHALERLQWLVPHLACGLLHSLGGRDEVTVIAAGSSGPEIHEALHRQLTCLAERIHPRGTPIPEALGRSPRWSSHLAVPLVSEDAVIGILMVVSTAPHAYDETDLAVLSIAAGQLAAFLALSARRRDELESLGREQIARQAADAANRAKDRLLSVVSHELRQPVNVILGWTQQLHDDLVPPETVKRALSAIQRNARLQSRLLDDLLDFARVTTGKLRLDNQPTNLSHTVAMTAETLRPAAESKGIAMRVTIPETPAVVSGDPTRLAQVVTNLLSNAVKFTEAGGSIEVTMECLPESVRLTVADTGMGIDPDFLPFVFDEFRQGHPVDRREAIGLGLGLAITRHLVELHGGRVEAFSDGREKGARFVVTLPLHIAR